MIEYRYNFPIAHMKVFSETVRNKYSLAVQDASMGWSELLFECSCPLSSWKKQWKVNVFVLFLVVLLFMIDRSSGKVAFCFFLVV